MNEAKTIGVLQCWHVAEKFRPCFGDLFDLFTALMKPAERGLVFRKYEFYDGEYTEHAEECQGYLITGSAWGVYEPYPGIARLMEFIRECYRKEIKQVGVCFGHQALAHALGGRAELSVKGWGLGVHTFPVQKTMPWMNPALKNVYLLYSHKDQVTKLPPNAVNLGGDDFCKNRMFVIDNLVLGIQGHPEFTKEYYTTTKEAQIEGLSKSLKTFVKNSFESPLDSEIVGQWMVNFLKAE
jgi:GMP synthase-like glutamine amidotransferase